MECGKWHSYDLPKIMSIESQLNIRIRANFLEQLFKKKTNNYLQSGPQANFCTPMVSATLQFSGML